MLMIHCGAVKVILIPLKELTARCLLLMLMLLKFQRLSLQLSRQTCLYWVTVVRLFLISLIENAINISDGKVKGDELALILGVGKELLRLPGRPFDGVRATLAKLKDLGNYHLVVFTKGELLDQGK